jgi:hypothetical protein
MKNNMIKYIQYVLIVILTVILIIGIFFLMKDYFFKKDNWEIINDDESGVDLDFPPYHTDSPLRPRGWPEAY